MLSMRQKMLTGSGENHDFEPVCTSIVNIIIRVYDSLIMRPKMRHMCAYVPCVDYYDTKHSIVILRQVAIYTRTSLRRIAFEPVALE